MLNLSQTSPRYRVSALLRTLLPLLLLTPLAISSGAQAAPELVSPEQTPVDAIERESERQVENLKQLYLTNDAVSALLQHLNAMLRSHAYSQERIVDLEKPQGLVYQLDVSDSRALVVRTSDYRKAGAATHGSISLDLSGIDPYVGYQCDARNRKCWINDPVDETSEWLTLAHEPAAAEKISMAMAELIKRLQKRVGAN
ncbi:hypothetical protein [Allohahella sp. A8]|uniref:hypothetical protein n=1 Tax=Allohahella sp. A8 TaxID=3141461 RepID=UPI000C09783E|nr:hypothetical protein [Hahellaceae bacterium]|tara:strand:- start:40694 stop:41290 length:597 start_codon:yes stop_codon:yes gene_type:complete